MIDTFLKAFVANRPGDLLMAVLIVIGAWIYKEVRNSLIEVDKQNTERIDKALLAYGELESALIRYKKDSETDYIQILTKAYPFFHKDLIKMAYLLKDEIREESIGKFLIALKDEIMRLKNLQNDSVSTQPSEYFIGELSFFLNKTKFSSFIQPIIFLIIAFIILGLFSVFVLQFDRTDIYGRIQLFSILAIGVTNTILFITFIEALISKQFRHSLKNWLLVFGFILFPGILCLVTRFYWMINIADFILNWIYIINFFRDSIKREKLV